MTGARGSTPAARAARDRDPGFLEERGDPLERARVAADPEGGVVAGRPGGGDLRSGPPREHVRERLVDLGRPERRDAPARAAGLRDLERDGIEQHGAAEPGAVGHPPRKERPSDREVVHPRLEPRPARRVRERREVVGERAEPAAGDEVRERDRLAALAPERRDEALEARAVRLDQAVEVERPRSRGLREAHRPAAHGDRHEAQAQTRQPVSPRRDGICAVLHRRGA